MPKKKITLEEAFAVFEREGLQVEVKAIQADEPLPRLADFLEQSEPVLSIPEPIGKKFLKITLYAAHTIGSGGQLVVDKNGEQHAENNGVESFGPGVVTVPQHLAQHLLHQDMLARQADERMLDRNMRSYVVLRKATSHGIVNAARLVSTDNGFNMSSFLGSLGESNIINL